MRILSLAATATLFSLAGPLAALAADPMHVRGVITSVDAGKVTVKTREGKDVSLMLGDNWKLAGIVPATLADVKPGTFIGTANMVGPSGAKALEVVVFPEAMRGTGEGDYGWDLKPNSSMTNANVKSEVNGVDGQTLTLAYKGGEKKVTIPPGTPIVTFAPVTAADVKPGAAVFMVTTPGSMADMFDKGFMAVGKDGAVPPM
jgi:hypothetical protein